MRRLLTLSVLLCIAASAAYAVTSTTTTLTITQGATAQVTGAVALNAAVGPSGVSGTVAFYDGNVILGFATISGGAATLTTKTLPIGKHSLYARYQGLSTTYAVSTSSALAFTVTGKASSGFSAASGSPISVTGANQIVTADFNNDGILDLAMLSGSSGSYAVTILLGAANGTFTQSSVTIPAPPTSDAPGVTAESITSATPISIAAADINQDGNVDILVLQNFTATGLSAGTIPYLLSGTGYALTLLAGNGSGSFTSSNLGYQAVNFSPVFNGAGVVNEYSAAYGLVVGDFDSTGMPEIAVGVTESQVSYVVGGSPPGVPTAGFISLFSSTGTLLSSTTTTTSPGGGYPTAVLPANWSGSGVPGVLVIGQSGEIVAPYTSNPGSSAFSLSSGGELTFSSAVLGAVATDFNGDGNADLAISTSAGLKIYLATAAATFSSTASSTVSPITTLHDITIGDINADGIPDLIFDDAATQNTYVALGSGTGSFAITSYSPFSSGITTGQVSAVSSLVTGNFGSSLNQDLAVTSNSNNKVAALVGSGPTIASIAPTSLVAGATNPSIVITGTGFGSADTVAITGSNGSSYSGTVTATTTTTVTATVPSAAVATVGTGSISVVVTDSSSGATSTAATVSVSPAAVLTMISPNFATVNGASFTMTLTGTNFPASATIAWTFNSTVTPLTPNAGGSTTSLTVTVPSTLLTTTGTATVAVMDNSSGVLSNTLTFSIAAAPVITSLSPTSVAANSGAFTLTINGSNFFNGDTVTWTPSSGTETTISNPTINSGGTQLTVTVPSTLITSTGTVSISVVDSTGHSSSVLQLTIAGPTVTSISPTGTTAGTTTAVSLTVNGANFTSGAEVTWCNACAGSPTIIAATFVSSTQLTATIPTTLLASAGTVQVGVIDGSATSASTQSFVIGSLTLSSITPASVAAGSPGFTLSVNGANFVPGTSVTNVVLSSGGTSTMLATSYVTSSLLEATVPSTSLTTPGTLSVTVVTGTSSSNAATLTVVSPTLTSVTPATSPTGAGSFTLAVAGSNFLSTSVVEWSNGSTVTPLTTTFTDAGDLVAIVPASLVTTAGTALITVQNTTGASSNGVVFAIGPSPTISTSGGVNPSSSAVGAGPVSITVTGTNYQNGSTVYWNNGTNTALVTGYVNATTLTATIPSSLLTSAGSALITVQNPNGSGTAISSNAATFTIAAGTVPTALTLVPASIAAGSVEFQIIVTGTNISSGSVIEWNSGTSTTALTTAYSSGQLSALVPASLVATAGPAFVSITNPGNLTSNSLTFTISSNQPTISTTGGVSPATTVVGSAATTIVVTGTNFIPTSTVQWNAGSSAVSLQTSYVSATTLDAVIPAADLASSGTALITVSNPSATVGGTASTSNSVIFSITPAGAPVINTTAGVAPSSAITGGTAFVITISGSNFFSGTVAYWSTGTTPTALTTSYISSSELSAVVPASLIAAAGTDFISVTNPGGVVSNSVTFVVGAAAGPTIGTLTPASATAGGAAFQLVVSGTNYATGSVVQWNTGSGVTALATIVLSSTQLSALVPANLIATSGLAYIDVMNTGGTTSNVESYTIAPGTAPTISTTGGLSPASATIGSASITLTVTGTGFISTSVVQWNNGTSTSSLTTIYNSSTQLSAVIPASDLSAALTAFVSVSNGTGSVSNSVPFSVAPPGAPTILTTGGLSPSTATVGSAGITLTINGTGFLSTSVAQWNNGTATSNLTTIYVSATQITAVVPSTDLTTALTAFVSVSNGTGSVSNSVPFSVAPPGAPTILTTGGLTPSTATVGSSSITLSITGTGFISTSVVQWNNGSTTTPLTTVYFSATQLSAVLPSTDLAAALTAFVSVSNGTGSVSNSVPFSVTALGAPTILSSGGISPATASAGGASFQIAITGTNFLSTSVVYWNSGTPTALTTSYLSSTQLTAIVPASLITTSTTVFISVQNPGPVSSNSVSFTIGASATIPLISSSGGLVPATMPAGSASFQLLVTGMNFVNGSVIQWNSGTGAATSLTTGYVSSTQLSALVPASLVSAPGLAIVTVVNPSNGGTSNSVTFTISGSVPVLTQLSPASAPAGTQNLALTVTGTGFAAGATVEWGTTALPTSFVSATQLTALVSATQLAAAASVNVTVVGSGGTSNAVAFTVIGPVITLLSPATVTAGAPAFTLAVGGDNFASGAVVNFGGTALTTTYVSSNSLMAAVPAASIASANSVSVTVVNPGGATSAAYGFAVGAVPAIQTLSPATASPGSAAITLTVTGTNFINGDTVLWNGVTLVTTFGSATTLTAAVPATLLVNSGSVNVTVLQGGGVASNASTFTISSATLTSISPTTAAAGSPATQLTVNGTAFVNGSTVQWNGTAIPTTYVSATQLSASVSNTLLTTPGTAYVAVSNPGGSTTAGVTFTIAGPTLTTIAPTTAVAGASAITLTLTGTNFVSTSVASWNGTALPTTVASATSASASVSTALLATAGTYVVVVTNPGGSVTASQFFTVTAPTAATISSLTPSSAIAGGPAFQITVAGSGFTSGSVVQWNGSGQPTSYVGPTQLTALIASSLIATAGTANITVQVPGAPLSATTQFPINPPAITTLSPTTVSAGGPAFTLSVTGGNFIPGSLVQWNGTNLPTIYNSATSLSADVAASLITSGGTASITVQNAAGAVSAPSTFTIGPFTLAISTTTLPDAVVGSNYSQILSATGGSPPYTWTVTSGSLPTGLALDAPSGTISGIATAAVVGTVGFTVTDSVARTTTKSIALRSVAALSITTVTPLTSAPAGVAFSQILAATGGTTPYTWGVIGNLPTGLAINPTTGQISGTPTVPGAYNFTITLADSRSQTLSSPFSQTITVSGVTIGGITAASTSGQQLPVSITIASPYAVDVTGSLTLVFTSAVGAGDPAIQFSSGGLTTNFTIPAGTTQANFGTQQSVLLLTGTTAGSIVVTAALQAGGASVTPATAPSITTTIAKAAPVITSVTVAASGQTITVTVSGYSNTRDMTTGAFQFIAATGSTVNGGTVSVNLASVFATYYQSSASLNYGSDFTVPVPIQFTGNVAAFGSVSVTFTNSAGTSAAVTATITQ